MSAGREVQRKLLESVIDMERASVRWPEGTLAGTVHDAFMAGARLMQERCAAALHQHWSAATVEWQRQYDNYWEGRADEAAASETAIKALSPEDL